MFVVHSLGGLLTQRALTISRESRFRHLQDIEACTVGICFLGTPHHGADLAIWGHVLANVISAAKPANSAPVKLLERGSEMLRDVQDGFHNLLEKRKDERKKKRQTPTSLPCAGQSMIRVEPHTELVHKRGRMR